MRSELGNGGGFKAEIVERGQKKKQLQGGGETFLRLTRSS